RRFRGLATAPGRDMRTIGLFLLSPVTGGASNPMSDMAHSVDVFAGRLRHSTRKQGRALANRDYPGGENRASGEPARPAGRRRAAGARGGEEPPRAPPPGGGGLVVGAVPPPQRRRYSSLMSEDDIPALTVADVHARLGTAGFFVYDNNGEGRWKRSHVPGAKN